VDEKPKGNGLADVGHILIVLAVVVAASILADAGKLDHASLSTVYGAAIGYASGLTVGRRNGNGH
jgi:hypothetical protein